MDRQTAGKWTEGRTDVALCHSHGKDSELSTRQCDKT